MHSLPEAVENPSSRYSSFDRRQEGQKFVGGGSYRSQHLWCVF